MAIPKEAVQQISDRFAALLPHVNERQRRLALGAEARLLGHGGVGTVARIAGVSETTVRRGIAEVAGTAEPSPDGRVRAPGGGRRRAEDSDPAVQRAFLGLVEPDERGDPESPLRWTTKSLRHLAEELTRQGHPVAAPTVGRLLRSMDFSLQANAKTLEGAQHPDRAAQFGSINDQVKEHQAAGEPVISVDAKKREHLGRLPMAGREWHPHGQGVEVESHSFFFSGPEVEQAIPYGIADLAHTTGWINVGIDHDTCVFAVESIGRWWRARGQLDSPKASRLLITADAGGSNRYRHHVWKRELAAFAAETGLLITVCHFPPGTSKWNTIEHRLFSYITLNWRGRPLTSHEVVVKAIAATRTDGGLRVEAALDTGDSPPGSAVSQERLQAVPLERHATPGTWNDSLSPYTVAGATGPAPVGEAGGPAQRRQAMLGKLADERLTSRSTTQREQLAARLAAAQAARTQQRSSEQRGGRARRASGKVRHKPLCDDAARLLLTLLYQRQVCSRNVLAELLEVTATCIGDHLKETREVLNDHRDDPGVAPVRFATAADLLTFLESDRRPARTAIVERLSDPDLTGLTRTELQALTQRLAARHAAQAERFGHQRRGGPRQPGARGGVFPQQISNHERVLLTVLYQRGLCTLDVLAAAFGDVCRSAIGNAVRETRPLLQQDGYFPAQASTRYRSASALLLATPSSRLTPVD